MGGHRATGSAWEARALAYLKRAGLVLLARNYTTRYGEIDLVMRDGDTVVFVEVRYREKHDFADAAMSVTRHKQGRLVRAASLFLQARPEWAQHPCRFDVLAFDHAADGTGCRWLRAAFDAF